MNLFVFNSVYSLRSTYHVRVSMRAPLHKRRAALTSPCCCEGICEGVFAEIFAKVFAEVFAKAFRSFDLEQIDKIISI